MTEREELEMLRIQMRIAELDEKEAQSRLDPVGRGEAAVVSAGRTVDKGISGVKDLYASATGDAAMKEAIRKDQAAKDKAFKPLADKYPITTAVGQAAPYLATAPLSGGLPFQAALGFGVDAMMHKDNAADRVASGAEGAMWTALPYGVGKAGSKLLSKNKAGGMAGVADELGYPLTPGERLGSPGMLRAEASMESFPLTSNTMHSYKAPRQDVVNRAVAREIGEKGDLADGAILGAEARIGNEFDEILTSKTFKADDEFVDSLVDIENKSKSLFSGAETEDLVNKVFDGLGEGGEVTGAQLQTWRGMLRRAAENAYKSPPSPEYADSLDELSDAIKDFITRNLSGDELKRWEKARKEWSAYKKVRKANAINELGDVSGRKLGNSLSSQDWKGYIGGRDQSDMYNAARLSRTYPPLPDSGTASRMSIPLIAAAMAKGGANLATLGAAPFAANAYLRGGDYLARSPQARGLLGAIMGRSMAGLNDAEASDVPYLLGGPPMRRKQK